METAHLYINQYVKTQSSLSYLIAIYVFQIEFDLKNLNDTRSFVLKQSFGIFNLL